MQQEYTKDGGITSLQWWPQRARKKPVSREENQGPDGSIAFKR